MTQQRIPAVRPGPSEPIESRVTQRRIPAVKESVTGAMPPARTRSGEKLDVDDPTRTMESVDVTARNPKFLPDELVKTQLTAQPGRTRVPTPAPKEDGPQPSVIVARQEVLTQPAPSAMLEQLKKESAAVEVRVGEPETPRTQVWVATHKPPENPDERLILVREPDSARAASFRVLRHRLQERGDPRVIAVTSAGPREGKTTCAVNLAMALGECGRARVLLVEANLRTPALAPLFGFLPPECFTAQMARHKEKPLDAWSVVEVFSPSLHVLAVKPDAPGRPLLDGPALAIAIEMLAQAGYDYLVIDTPPVLGAADVNLIEDCADGVLFTAWSRTTSGRALRQAVEQLAPAKLLGVTLLDV